jgi:nucleoside-diphosphate-sugar epimerase
LNAATEEIRDYYSGKRVLVTGGGGYLGTNLINLLSCIDCHIVRLGRSPEAFSPVTPGAARVSEMKGDVRDRQSWKEALADIDVVFHFAAQTSVPRAEADARADLENNVLPMVTLLEVCRQNGFQPSVIFSGTVTEAGIPECLPVSEAHRDKPVTVYDLHKLMAENYLKYYAAHGTVRGATLRLANVYGPGPKSSSADRGVLNMMIRKAINGEPLTVYGEGTNLRDYSFVEDVVVAFVEAARNIDRVNGAHFVIGSGHGHTIDEAARLVSERVALKTNVRADVRHVDPPQPQPAINDRNFVADSRLFMQATGWEPRWSFADGIDRTIEAFTCES